MSSIVSWPLYHYVLKAVKRDRVIQLMIAMMGLAALVASFLGDAATLERTQYAIATAGTSLRTIAVLGLIIFIAFFTRRCFDSREIDYLLATPLTRYRMLFSMSLAFVTVAALMAVVVTGVMFFLSHKINEGLVVWGASVVVELMITAMIALFFSIVLKSATVSALCSLGLYSLARMMGIMIGIIEAKIEIHSSLFNQWLELWVKFFSIIIPRFDLLSQSAWIVYGNAEGLPLWILPVQALVFCTLFFVCAAFDLRRSQF